MPQICDHTPFCLWLLGGLLMASQGWQLGTAAHAAEIRGTVYIRNTGLFSPDSTTRESRISVAALPLEGQAVPASRPSTHRMVLKNKHFRPSYLIVRRGDSVEFVNEDDVVHEVFSLSSDRLLDIRLAKRTSGGKSHEFVTLEDDAVIHLFCRIHSRTYARIDVVDTPHIGMPGPDGSFAFDNLDTGRWKLRVAAPGAETLFLETIAHTSPPRLEVELRSRGGVPMSGEKTGLPAGDAALLYPRY